MILHSMIPCPVPLSELVLPAMRQMCKTNPNRERGQNRKTAFFHGNMNISIRIRPGDETCFYETNPNKELQDPWWHGFVKKPMLGRNKANPNKEIETGKTLHDRKFHPRPERQNLFTKLFGCPIQSGPIRPDPTGSDPIRVNATL